MRYGQCERSAIRGRRLHVGSDWLDAFWFLTEPTVLSLPPATPRAETGPAAGACLAVLLFVMIHVRNTAYRSHTQFRYVYLPFGREFDNTATVDFLHQLDTCTRCRAHLTAIVARVELNAAHYGTDGQGTKRVGVSFHWFH